VKRPAKELIACLERHGYEYDRTNTKGWEIWISGDHEVPVNPSMQEHVAKSLVRDLQKRHGTAAKPNKRNVANIRERQERQRQALRADIEQHRARLDEILAARSQRLDGLGLVATEEEIRRITKHIEAREAELRELQRLMSTPGLDNRARHRSGA
jgi:hypothetical protein